MWCQSTLVGMGPVGPNQGFMGLTYLIPGLLVDASLMFMDKTVTSWSLVDMANVLIFLYNVLSFSTGSADFFHQLNIDNSTF